MVLINKFEWYWVRSCHTEVEDSAVLRFDVFAASIVRFYALNGFFEVEDGRHQSSAAPVNTASYLGSLEFSLYSANTTEFRFLLVCYLVVRHGQFQPHRLQFSHKPPWH